MIDHLKCDTYSNFSSIKYMVRINNNFENLNENLGNFHRWKKILPVNKKQCAMPNVWCKLVQFTHSETNFLPQVIYCSIKYSHHRVSYCISDNTIITNVSRLELDIFYESSPMIFSKIFSSLLLYIILLFNTEIRTSFFFKLTFSNYF